MQFGVGADLAARIRMAANLCEPAAHLLFDGDNGYRNVNQRLLRHYLGAVEQGRWHVRARRDVRRGASLLWDLFGSGGRLKRRRVAGRDGSTVGVFRERRWIVATVRSL